MQKMKKRWGLSLAGLMVTGSLLAGCGSADTPQQSPAATAAEATKGPPEKLIWYVRYSEPANAKAVVAKANELIQSKINATLDLRFINPGDYDNKMQLIMSSGEEYDLAFTSAWANNYLNNVDRGAYIPLDDMLVKYPDLQTILRKEVWNAVKVKGHTYGIPNNQIMVSQDGIWFKKDIAEKYGLDVQNVKSLEDLGKLYAAVKEKEPAIIPLRAGTVSFGFNSYVPNVENLFSIDTATWKVYDKTQNYVDEYKAFREWYQKGYFPQDVATLKDETSLIKAGKIFSRYGRQKPGGDAELRAAYGFDVVQTATGKPIIGRSAALSTLTAISATSKKPELAMQLIHLVNTDKDLINLLSFGIEGADYTKIGDKRIEKKPGSYELPSWIVGNVFNSYLLPGQPDDVWEQTKKVNETAQIDPLISFNFDRTSVENEMARLTAIEKEFQPILDNGLDDTDKILKLREEKMKAAGFDKVLAEVQRQLDEWRKTQK
ncbi:ABC transporter substrate-binding protein [Paenibacillus silviterrae]|uniref:ABC transporter substrate-binding protein n=1 Tax=Paenibacillus silviterrae TaxID=3242194 RepID=UPI002542C251|nr:ABC transporter substrate-binding protein [Paenibacillus chinjuensis]